MSEGATSKYTELRTSLIQKGTNLRRWAKQNKLPVSSVYAAAKNQRSGIEAERIRTRLAKFLTCKATTSN